mgnify:FL=1
MSKRKRAEPPRLNKHPKFAHPDYTWHEKPCKDCGRVYCPCASGKLPGEIIRDVR